MTRFSNFFLLILAGISFLFMSSVYVVDEREKALRSVSYTHLRAHET